MLRDGKPTTVTVKLDASSQTTRNAEQMTPALQGATLSDGAAKDGTKGVNIDEIEKGTPAEQFGLQKGDVIIGLNRTRIQSWRSCVSCWMPNRHC